MFNLKSLFKPVGDQVNAIKVISKGIKKEEKSQVLLGITGSGKTFTMANVIAESRLPTLVIAHNKTLAGQLFQEFNSFFPDDHVEYFVSYYNHYQPEAYIPRGDRYVEKTFSVNKDIEKMRIRATNSLVKHKNVIVIASVSCIYGLGDPSYAQPFELKLGDSFTKREFEETLNIKGYMGNFSYKNGLFEIGENEDKVKISFSRDRIVNIFKGEEFRSISMDVGAHHITPKDVLKKGMKKIKQELVERLEYYETRSMYTEADRLRKKTLLDLENLKEIGRCKGIENYSLHFSDRVLGEPPFCLLDFFPDKFLTVVDESHQMVPQIKSLCAGDRSRKKSLIEYGFRLPSAYENRPLTFEEFYRKTESIVYVSATPGKWEIEDAGGYVSQAIRPTGLLEPTIEVRNIEDQLEDSIGAINQEISTGGAVLLSTVTKKLAEDISEYLLTLDIKSEYVHSDVKTLDRLSKIRSLREGKIKVLVGVNLLREGLDLPEVTLVLVLDADHEGFLRSTTSLEQLCGRAARNVKGRVIMYAAKITRSMKSFMEKSKERRERQILYNREHGLLPKNIVSKDKGSILDKFST